MQMLGKFGGETKLIFYIFCPPPFKKRSRATDQSICELVGLLSVINNIFFQTFKDIKMVLQYNAIRKEIIFCRCGSYLWLFRILHSAPFFFSRFRTGIADRNSARCWR